MQKIKKGDEIIVTTGKDKGKRGKVLRVITKMDGLRRKVVVEGVNLIKKHVRPNPQRNIDGGILEKEAAIDISNVALFNPKTQKADRVGIKTLADGRKVRYFKSNDEIVDVI